MLLALPSLLWGQTAVEVQVTPAQLRLKVAQEERLFLSAYDADGNLLTAPTFSFAVSKAGVVSVDREGTVVGVAPGKASIEVRSGTGSATVAVTVTGPPPPPREPEPMPVLPAGARLVPTPDSLWLLRLETARVSMGLVVPDGSGLGQVQVSWRSTAPDIVSVTETGEVTALQLGQAQVIGTGLGGLTGTVQVVVRDDSLAVTPDHLVLPVTGVDSVRVSVPAQGDRTLTYGLAWRSSDSTVVAVGREGLARGVAPGEAYMLLIGYGQQRAVRVTVHPPIDRLLLAPAPNTPIRLTPGATTAFVLQGLAADSTPVAAAGYEWVVGDTTVATFDPAARRLTARGLGRTTLGMTTFGFEPTVWDIEVVAGGLAFERPRLRLLPGMRDSLLVSLLDVDGRAIGRPSSVEYTIDRPEVATVDRNGVVTAASVGGATITARTPWGTAATARLFVTDDLLLSIRRGAGADLVQVDPEDAGSLVPLRADGNLNEQAVWSPDGTRIAFSGTVDGNTDIYVMDADGKNLTRLTTAPEQDSEPAWAPDGGTIAFTSQRGGTPQIWAMNVDGTGLRQLTSGNGANTSPVFRRDGKMLAFISTRDGNADLFEMGNEGADPQAITRTPEAESHPAYFPNGDLAVVVTRPGRGDILRIRAGDGQRIMLQSMAGTITSLALAPGGGTLAFTLAQPAVDPTAPPVTSFQIKGLAPDLAPLALPVSGDVISAAFQRSR
ncbi:MAG: Ig-like domain-containing protein [Gemmatimonadales bacterium]